MYTRATRNLQTGIYVNLIANQSFAPVCQWSHTIFRLSICSTDNPAVNNLSFHGSPRQVQVRLGVHTKDV